MKRQRQVPDLTKKEIENFVDTAQNSMAELATEMGIGGLSCAQDWNFYRAVEDAIFNEWHKSRRLREYAGGQPERAMVTKAELEEALDNLRREILNLES